MTASLRSTSPAVATGASTETTSILELHELEVSYRIEGVLTPVVRSASFSVGRDEIVGLVGESGSGKTVTAMASLGLTSSLGGRVTGGRIVLDGQDVTDLSDAKWQRLRGRVAGLVLQQPTRSLNPAFTVGTQIAEAARRHLGLTRKDAWARAVAMLDRVHIAKADGRANDYPHQFSGGMCQRVAIALALVSSPKLLIADEPTTALDVTVQKRILDLLLELREDSGFAVLLITHDLGIVAQTCDRVAVMYAGEVVERAPVIDLFVSPQHPYTDGLLGSIPKRGRSIGELVAIPGQVPPPDLMPEGCRFHPRCDHCVEKCTTGTPELFEVTPGRWTRCVRAGELELSGVRT